MNIFTKSLHKAGLVFLLLSCTITKLSATYTLYDDDVIVENGFIVSCSYDFSDKDLVIPETLDGQTVIGIEDQRNSTGVFYNKGLTSVKLPTTIKEIGGKAFYNNAIETVNFSELTNLEIIGGYAFKNNNLEILDLSACEKLQMIYDQSFSRNPVESMILPTVSISGFEGWLDNNGNEFDGNDEVNIGSNLYRAKVPYTLKDNDVVVENGMITSCSYNFAGSIITIPDVLDGQAVTAIDGSYSQANGIFYNKHIVRLVLPNLDSIGEHAFLLNSMLEEVDFSNCKNLKVIKKYAFSRCNIRTINLSNLNKLVNIQFEAFSNNQTDSLSLTNCSSLKNIEYSAFKSNKIKHVDFSDCESLESIDRYAFNYNVIEEFNLDRCNKLKYIGFYAFGNNLTTELILPESNYEGFKFWRNKNGQHIKAGTKISDFTSDYWAVINYTLTDNDVIVNNNLLESCSYNFEFTDITIPTNLDGQEVYGIDNMAFKNKGLSSVTLPQSLKYIKEQAFSANQDLYKVNFSGKNLERIEKTVFTQANIDTIDLSNQTKLEFIGAAAFRCNVKVVNISNCTNIDTLYGSVFASSKIDSVNLEGCSAIKYIDEDAFQGANNLSLKLPLSENGSVYGWRDGKNQSYSAGNIVNDFTTFYRIPISYTLTNDDVEMLDGKIESCSYNFEYSDIIVPENLDGQTVTGICDKEQYNGVFIEKGITSLILPSTLDYIGDYAFEENRIDTLDLSVCNPTYIGKNAFFDNEMDALIIAGNSNLQTIGTSAFKKNIFDSLDLSGLSNLETISYGAFQQCQIQRLVLDNCTKLKIIDDYAFYANNITEISNAGSVAIKRIGARAFYRNNFITFDYSIFPNLEYIGEWAFYDNDINTLDLSVINKLCYIGEKAFSRNRFTSFTLPIHPSTEIKWIDEDYNSFSQGAEISNLDQTYRIPMVYTLTDDDVVMLNNTIMGCSYHFSFKDIAIPETLDGQHVEQIADNSSNIYDDERGVFASKGIFSIQLPSSIKKIGAFAFSDNQIDTIDFSGCSELTHLYNNCFFENYSHSVLWNVNLEYLGKYAFEKNNFPLNDFADFAENCTRLTYIGKNALRGKSTNNFVIPTPEYDDFEHWESVDKYDNITTVHGGSYVSTYNKYTAIFTTARTYSIQFTVSNGETPISNAIITINGQSHTTNGSGKATFENIPQGLINFSVSADDYETLNDDIDLVDDMEKNIVLTASSGGETSLIENKAEFLVQVYPNPARNYVTITTIEGQVIEKITLLDPSGRRISQSEIYNSGETKLNVAKFKPGMYLILIETDKSKSIERLVIQ